MRLLHRSLPAVIIIGSSIALAQTPDPQAPAANKPAAQEVSSPATGAAVATPTSDWLASHCRPAGQPGMPMDEKPPCPPGYEPIAQAVVSKPNYTVPAGTKVLLQLRSSINTKSAKPGDGVYLSSTFPVVVGNRVMIPSGVYVQGVVDRVARAGHVKGSAQLDMHFTSIIFPNGSVVEIPGMVNSLPGSSKQTVKDDGEGTVQQDPDKTRTLGETAKIAVPTGATVGAIGGLGSGHPLAGGIAGVGAGLATAGLVSLFTRGADVNIQSGTQIEMVLQRPLILEEENLAGVGAPGAPPSFVPSSNQPRPIEKPGRTRAICLPGSPGCE